MTRGDIYMLDFGIPFGSEPGRRRPESNTYSFFHADSWEHIKSQQQVKRAPLTRCYFTGIIIIHSNKLSTEPTNFSKGILNRK